MSLPKNIRKEFIMALTPYAREGIPDSVMLSAWGAAENILQMAKKMNLIDDLPEVEGVTYQHETLLITIDGETIEIPRLQND